MFLRIALFLLLLPVVAQAGKIQEVIDKAMPGDTIRIRAGLYKENTIIIRKPLTLIGEGYPIFDGELKQEVFIITSSRVNIQGIDIRNTGRSSMTDMAGVKLQNVSYVSVKACKFYNTTYAVYLQNSHYCTITGNIIQAVAKDELQSGNGVHAWKSSHLKITGNTISGHRDGIYFEFVTASEISYNKSFNNIRYGLHFMFSHNDVYSHNVFLNNGAGVAVMYTKHVTMYKNVFDLNWGDATYGILLKDISDSKVISNTFHKNTIGIYMEGCNRIHIAGNAFAENGWALRIQASCEGNIVEKNNFDGNSFDVATNGSNMMNVFRANYWDKYEGYDLNKDGTGDVPHYPVSLYSVISEKVPAAMILYRSFLTNVMDQAEKVMPSIIPELLRDNEPKTRKWKL
jgi:nitrous oxidase accessory protein